MVSACSTRHHTGDTDSFQLVIPLTVQLYNQGTFVPYAARIVWYSAGRTSSRQLRDTTLSLMAVWFLIGETHRGQQVTPALPLPQVRYGLSVLLLEVFCTPGVDSICRQVQRQLLRNESARFYHHRTRKCIPPRKLRREIQ